MSHDGDAGIRLEHDGPIATIRLDRPDVLNAIDQPMRDRWIELLREVERRVPETRVLIVTGTGRAFCSGGDVDEQDQYMGPTAHDGWMGQYRYQELVRYMRDMSIPVIAAVNGLALGGGMAVALMADFRVASEQATFGVGQIVRGFVPDVGLTYILPRITGTSRALQLMMLNERLDAQQALDLGIVNWVVPPDEVMPKALEVARQIVASPVAAVEWIKRVTYDSQEVPFATALRLESMAQGILCDRPEFEQSLADFRAARAERREARGRAEAR